MKKIILLLSIFVNCLCSMAQPQIANFSFENWATRYTKVAPVGWICDSIGIINGSVKRATTASDGVSAIQIGTTSYQGNIISSLIQRDDSLTTIPGNLSFDYMVFNNKTSLVNGLYIEIYFKDAKKKDLKDFNWSSSGNNSTYASGIIPISFGTGQIPKYYTLIISYFNVGGLTEEYTIVDNLKFAKPSAAIKTLSNSTICVYPNPANGILNFTDEAKDKLIKVRLISITGQSLEYPVNNSSIDLSNLSSGIYTLELIDIDHQIIKREKLSVLN